MTVLSVVIVAILVYTLLNSARPTTNEANDNAARERFATLAQAAWRQDEGRGNTLITATLYTPTISQTLGADSGRSDFEDQLWGAVKDVTDRQIPIYVTVDTIGAAVTDEQFRQVLQLVVDEKTTRLVSWSSLIMPSRVVNTPYQTRSQTGVAIFEQDQPLDWAAVKQVTLTVNGIGDQAKRQLVWNQPSLWSATEP